MRYMMRWRMLIATDWLPFSGIQIADLAPMLCHESERAFGVAFKRVMGCSPRRFIKPKSLAERGNEAPRERTLRSAA